MVWSAVISWIVLRPLIASKATLALNSGLWVLLLLISGSPLQGRYPTSAVNDGTCPGKQDHNNALNHYGTVKQISQVNSFVQQYPCQEQRWELVIYPGSICMFAPTVFVQARISGVQAQFILN